MNLADLLGLGHNFIDSYMAAGHDAETVILDNVVNIINKLNPTVIGNTTAIFIAGAASGHIGEYDSAAVSVSLDPAKINWIAWNDAPQVQLTRHSRPGEYFLGPGGFGTNDYITLTVVAPDVFRQNPSFAHPPNLERFLDEGGSHNAIFFESGIYEFRFSFQDERFGGGGGDHSNIYLLINDHQ